VADLKCSPAAIVLSELYDLLLGTLAGDADERLGQLALSVESLRAMVEGYQLAWEFQERPTVDAAGTLVSSPVTNPVHARLAQYILSGVRTNCDTVSLQSDLVARVRSAFESVPGYSGHLPDCAQPVVIAWGLGMRYGSLDFTYPAVPAIVHSNANIDHAYMGLVEHLTLTAQAYGNGIDDWPELVRNAVLWRTVAIFDGLGKLEAALAGNSTSGSRGGPADAATRLVGLAGSYLSSGQQSRYGRAWERMVAIRDGLSHVMQGDRRYAFDFTAAAAETATWSDLGQLALEGLTALMLFITADDASSADPRSIRSAIDTVETDLAWVRSAYR
jgi:hypothetical protein